MGAIPVRNIALALTFMTLVASLACGEALAIDPVDATSTATGAGSPGSSSPDFSPVEPTPTETISLFDRVWRTRLDNAIGDEHCDGPLRELNPAHYTGPLIDTHLHIPWLPDSDPVQGELTGPYLDAVGIERINLEFPMLGVNRSMAEIACTLVRERTDAVFAFFPMFLHAPERSVEVAKLTMDRHPNLFFPFVNPPGRGAATVENYVLVERLNVYPGLFKGYGEIPLYSDGSPGDFGLPPDSAIFDDIYKTAERESLAVYFHAGTDQLDSFSKVLSENPNTSFIVHGEQIEFDVTQLMALHDNIYFTVNDLYGDQYLLHQGETTRSFVEKISGIEPLLEKDLGTWKEAIEAFPDQFVWGTDRGGIAVWTFDVEVGIALNDYARAFISRLDPDVQERFAYKNALRAMKRDTANWPPLE